METAGACADPEVLREKPREKKKKGRKLMVYVHLADGFEEIEAITVVDVLRRAGIDVRTVAIHAENEIPADAQAALIKGAHDIKIKADLLFKDADYTKCDMIVLPGGMPGAANLGAHKGLTSAIKEFASAGKPLAAICAAPMIFGNLGILAGKRATIYPGMESFLKGAEAVQDRVAVDGNFITSRGPATAMDFALAIVEFLKSGGSADKLAADMLCRR